MRLRFNNKEGRAASVGGVMDLIAGLKTGSFSSGVKIENIFMDGASFLRAGAGKVAEFSEVT